MNTNEKKIFFSLFTFNLLGFIAIIAILTTLIYTGFSYLANTFPDHSDNTLLIGKIVCGILIFLSLTKIKSIYLQAKKSTLNYVNSIKEN